jgi:flagellar hook-length control protein FliK
MMNQLLPLLELGASNKLNRPSLDRAAETKDQGFSRTFQDAEKEITSNKADAQAAKDARSERQESSSKNNQSSNNQPADTTKVASADDKKIDSQEPTKQANSADNTDVGESSKLASDAVDASEKKAGNVSADAGVEGNSESSVLTNTVDPTVIRTAISSELSAIISPDVQSLLEGLLKQLHSVDGGQGLEDEIDPKALELLTGELFFDSSELPIADLANTITQTLSNQPLTVASAAQFINDLKSYAQLSPAIENAGLKLSADLTSQAALTSVGSTNLIGQSNLLGAGLTGDRLETLTLQASTDITSTSIADKFSVDKLNFAQLLNSSATGSESSTAKLSTDISPLHALTNTPLMAAAASPKPQLAVGTPFQQAQWGEAVAERVMWMSSQGLQEAEIHLNPSELGPMQVKVSVVNEQAHVSFVVNNATVREALDQNAIRLREMFNGEGLNLVDVDVSDQSQQQASNSEDESNQPHFSGERSESDLIQGENQLSINSNGTSLLSLYA